MTVRTQYGVPSALATVNNTAPVAFTVNRPRTLPVERNTIDHVARPYRRQEFEGGLAVLQLNAACAIGDVAVRAVEIMAWDGTVARTVLSTTGNEYLGNATITTELLARLIIAEDEAGARVSLFKVTGGTIASCGLTGRFDFGLHNANYGSNQGL
jgi:hypothetical protein